MKFRSILCFLAAILFFSGILSAEEAPGLKTDSNKEIEDTCKIVILPLYDYSESSLKYLSTYIPELLADHISIYNGIDVYDPDDLRKKILLKDISSELLYYEDSALEFLKGLKADIGINGRYIIQGETIKININIIEIKTGKIESLDEFNGVINNSLLETLDRFARISSDTIAKNVLVNIVTDLDLKKKPHTREYIERIRDSRIGRLISNKWVFAVIVIIIFYIVSRFASMAIKKFFQKFIPPAAHAAIDEKVIRKFRRTLRHIIVLFGFKVSLIIMDLTPKVSDILSDFISAFIIALVSYAFIIIIESTIRFWGEDVKEKINPRVNKDLMPLFVTFAKITIVTISVIIILSKFDIDVGPFIASIGLLGVALGFAVKDSVADLIGGIFLALDHSIAAGDTVTIDNDMGVIKEVGLRNTKLLTFDNEIIVIPNRELSSKKYTNFVLPDPSYRVVVNFGVAYGSDVDRVQEVVISALKKLPGIQDDPAPLISFIEMADFSLNFKLKFWIPDYEARLYYRSEATKMIYNAFNEAEITIPFPTRTLYMKHE